MGIWNNNFNMFTDISIGFFINKIKECAETIDNKIFPKIEELEEEIAHIDPEVVKKYYEYKTGASVNLNREYYFEAEELRDNEDTEYMRRPNAFCMDDYYFYLFYTNLKANKVKLIRVDKRTFTTYIRQFNIIKAGTACCVGNYIYITTGTLEGGIIKMNKSDFTYVTLNTSVQIGSITYDKEKEVFYGRGGITSSSGDTIYRLEMHPNSVVSTPLFDVTNPTLHSVAQGITVHDGMLYRAYSNPNYIVVYDIENDGKILESIKIRYRLDDVLPVGELQDIDFYEGKLYALCHNRSMVSGKIYLDVIGSTDLKATTIVESFDPSASNATIYVDFSRPVRSTKEGKNAQTMYNATGWESTYDTSPFKYLWEAVEAAAGIYQRCNVRSIIAVHEGGKDHYDKICDIYGSFVRQITPAETDGYVKLIGSGDFIGCDLLLNRCIFNVNDTKTSSAMAFRALGGAVCTRECAFIYSGSAPGSSVYYVNCINGAFVTIGRSMRYALSGTDYDLTTHIESGFSALTKTSVTTPYNEYEGVVKIY